jgi:hypothetical protein
MVFLNMGGDLLERAPYLTIRTYDHKEQFEVDKKGRHLPYDIVERMLVRGTCLGRFKGN